MKIFDDEVYQQLTGGRLDPVLNTIKYLRDNGVWVEVTNLIVPDWTDDMDAIRKMCKWMSSNKLTGNSIPGSSHRLPQIRLPCQNGLDTVISIYLFTVGA